MTESELIICNKDNNIELCMFCDKIDLEITDHNYNSTNISISISDVVKIRDYLNECIDELNKPEVQDGDD